MSNTPKINPNSNTSEFPNVNIPFNTRDFARMCGYLNSMIPENAFVQAEHYGIVRQFSLDIKRKLCYINDPIVLRGLNDFFLVRLDHYTGHPLSLEITKYLNSLINHRNFHMLTICGFESCALQRPYSAMDLKFESFRNTFNIY